MKRFTILVIMTTALLFMGCPDGSGGSAGPTQTQVEEAYALT